MKHGDVTINILDLLLHLLCSILDAFRRTSKSSIMIRHSRGRDLVLKDTRAVLIGTGAPAIAKVGMAPARASLVVLLESGLVDNPSRELARLMSLERTIRRVMYAHLGDILWVTVPGLELMIEAAGQPGVLFSGHM